MKKIVAVLILALAVVCSAQESSLKPGFQAFSGALVKLKKADQGFHKFMLKVDVAPWAFMAEGEVMAPGGDSDVLITALFDGALYAVLAYIPDKVTGGSDGEEYNVGFFDMMLYYEDEPTRIRNLKFTLLPPANDSWAKGILKDALESGSLLGQIWKGKYEREITRASATPIDKSRLLDMQRQRVEDRERNAAEMAKREEEARETRKAAAEAERLAKKAAAEEALAAEEAKCTSGKKLSAKEKRQCKAYLKKNKKSKKRK